MDNKSSLLSNYSILNNYHYINGINNDGIKYNEAADESRRGVGLFVDEPLLQLLGLLHGFAGLICFHGVFDDLLQIKFIEIKPLEEAFLIKRKTFQQDLMHINLPQI